MKAAKPAVDLLRYGGVEEPVPVGRDEVGKTRRVAVCVTIRMLGVVLVDSVKNVDGKPNVVEIMIIARLESPENIAIVVVKDITRE